MFAPRRTQDAGAQARMIDEAGDSQLFPSSLLARRRRRPSFAIFLLFMPPTTAITTREALAARVAADVARRCRSISALAGRHAPARKPDSREAGASAARKSEARRVSSAALLHCRAPLLEKSKSPHLAAAVAAPSCSAPASRPQGEFPLEHLQSY